MISLLIYIGAGVGLASMEAYTHGVTFNWYVGVAVWFLVGGLIWRQRNGGMI